MASSAWKPIECAVARQGPEGAPDAWLEIEPRFGEALLGMEVGHELIVITWLHEANRDVLQGHPRSDPRRPITGVFYTRSPAPPNPFGLHPVSVREIDGTRLKMLRLWCENALSTSRSVKDTEKKRHV